MALDIRIAGRYRLGRKIGSGSFGDIYLGEEARTSVVVHLALPLLKTRSGDRLAYSHWGGGWHQVGTYLQAGCCLADNLA